MPDPTPQNHDWKRANWDATKIDTCAWDVDDPEGAGGHNGPVCLRCGWSPCIHCELKALENAECPHPDGDEETAKYHWENPDA
jgi:hypothetical protein